MTSQDSVVLLGDNLTEWGDFSGLSGRFRPCGAAGPVNHGCAGDTTRTLLDRLHETTMLRPGWVFVQAGINDLAQGSAPEELVARLSKIWARIALESPGTRVGVLNLLPLCPGRFEWTGFSLNNPLIRRVNAAIQEAASRSGALYLDLYAAYADPKGDLPENYTQDGLNLLPEAYGPWTELLITVLQKEGLSRGAASREGGSAGGGEEPARGA